MTTAFVVDKATTGLQPVSGPKDKRVPLLSDLNSEVPGLPAMNWIATPNYEERMTRRDAATGRSLAVSDHFEPSGG